ncbi:hypothetical protein QAD02_005688 [Eretmocerus hayati]|uniref:Uncharacterized protein n=1 Tax=Eretmocerus hayati TaxID=131215 RepID=A0ACC2NUY9_9HYME|nr:hypothetical protein QAD02_005688 [Eretmocerus hayati]
MDLNELILFDNLCATYTPGQTVTGRVVIGIDSPKKIRGIKLVFKGEADTYFSQWKKCINVNGRLISKTQKLTGHEKYFEASSYLIESALGKELVLKPGIHEYKFSFRLPHNLPSSVELAYGHIRYTTTAIIERPWKSDQEFKTFFTVVSDFGLNLHQNGLVSVQTEAKWDLSRFCCISRPLSINISVPTRVYVPGQTISIKVNVENESGKWVDAVKLILQKVITYSATTPRKDRKIMKEKIVGVSAGPIGDKQIISYEQKLVVPPLLASNLQNGGIIHFEYELTVEACIQGGTTHTFEEGTPIYISTVPFSDDQKPQPPTSKVQEFMQQPSAPEEHLLNSQQNIQPICRLR